MRDERGGGQGGEIRQGCLRSGAVEPAPDDAPDTAVAVVAGWMSEGNLVVADDGVVEIGNPEGPVGAEFDLDGAEGGVVAGEEIGLAGGGGRSAAPIEAVAVDAAGDGVAVEEVILEFGREILGRVMSDAGDGAGAVIIGGDRGGEAEAVVFFADALVEAAGDEEVDGL